MELKYCANCGSRKWNVLRMVTVTQETAIEDGDVDQRWETLKEDIHTQEVVCRSCKSKTTHAYAMKDDWFEWI